MCYEDLILFISGLHLCRQLLSQDKCVCTGTSGGYCTNLHHQYTMITMHSCVQLLHSSPMLSCISDLCTLILLHY